MAVFVVLGCSSPTGQLSPSEDLPEVAGIELDASRLMSGGLVSFLLQPADPLFRLGKTSFLPATIRSSSGDVEQVRLRPNVCQSASRGRVLCRYFAVYARSGHVVSEIEGQLREFGGRFALIASNGSFARVYPFADESATRYLARRLPAVSQVSDISVLSLGNSAAGDAELSVVIQFEIGTPVRDDGAMSAAAGDSITFEYSSGTGVISRYAVVVPDGNR